MLYAIVVVLKRIAGVVGRVDIDAVNPPGELLLKRLEREQVVAVNEDVVEGVAVRYTRLRVIGLVRIFQEDARFKARTIILANLCEFEALLAVAHDARRCSFFC